MHGRGFERGFGRSRRFGRGRGMGRGVTWGGFFENPNPGEVRSFLEKRKQALQNELAVAKLRLDELEG